MGVARIMPRSDTRSKPRYFKYLSRSDSSTGYPGLTRELSGNPETTMTIGWKISFQ
jgi:hypothetical protein